MSWGYWGIVTSLLVLLTLFFFCIDLLYDAQQKFTESETTGAPGGETESVSGVKHAA